VRRKLAAPHRYQTRSRGFDGDQLGLVVTDEGQDSDTEVNEGWLEPAPRYNNYELGPTFDFWADEDSMASSSVERGGRKFSGDQGGLPLQHLKQASQALDVQIKMKPQGLNLTDNDRFVLLTDLLEGGARSQAHQLQERMQKDLDARNAADLKKYEDAVRMHPLRTAEWNALPPAGRGPAPVAPPLAPPVVATLFRDPLGQFWTLFNRLYPERSSSRIEEYRDFKALSGESTPNLVTA